MVDIAIISVMIMSMATTSNSLVDFHSHCLPAVDDGAANVEIASAMLQMVQKQGAKAVIATPHFYWGHHTVADFLQKRQEAYDSLYGCQKSLPPILLGAEVLLREGISKVDLRPLCIDGTRILLVELPFMRPPVWLFEELEEIAYTQRLTIMLAHLDRYMPWYSGEKLERLLELPGVIVQINAEMLTTRRDFRALRKWLRHQPERLVLGSDMHNTTERAPLLDKALRTLSSGRTGRVWLDLIEDTTDRIDRRTISDQGGGFI